MNVNYQSITNLYTIYVHSIIKSSSIIVYEINSKTVLINDHDYLDFFNKIIFVIKINLEWNEISKRKLNEL